MKWTQLQLNRRECLEGMIALAAPIGISRGPATEAREECTLRNANIDFSLVIHKGRITSRGLTNLLANERVDLPETDFAFEFDGGAVADSSQFTATVVLKNPERLELLYSGATDAVAGLQVRAQYTLRPSKAYLRKQLSVRLTHNGAPRRLMRADLDDWQRVKRDWQSATTDRMRKGSHPITCETMWAGVEFVAAFNEYSGSGFVLRSRPGGKTVTSDWLTLHSTVAGVAETNQVKAAFLHYIDDVRVAPPRLVAAYNTYWSLGDVFSEKELMALVKALVENLRAKHGIFFDFVTADAGWSDPQSIWRVNPRDFPEGLGAISKTIRSAGGKLGLWMSPSEVYRFVIDWDWAEKEGYRVIAPENDPFDPHGKGISLADPKYLTAAKQQLRRLIKDYQLGQVKYDGFIAREGQGHDGLVPGDDSIEPLAEHSLELITASKEANANLVAEPTYLNSWASYISPWMIMYADCVWANSGGDSPPGVGPSPDYRESHTTAREYYIFSSLDEVWLPQNAVQYFDIIQCDAANGFPNHAAMAFGRGRFFVSTYISPKFMTEEDWRIYAGLLKWGRRNQDVLQNTVVLTSRVELGEPYAYAHWKGARGIIAIRNPSNESRKFILDLARAKAPKELANAVCYAQYPYREGVAERVDNTSTMALDLAPWELVFLEIAPRGELSEPVAMGARWIRDSNGSMKVLPEGPGNIRVLLPHGGEQVVTSTAITAGDPHGLVRSKKIDPLPLIDWSHHRDKRLPTGAFELDCEITIPEGAAKGKALLLLEFPGREHFPSTCSCQMNGRGVPLQESTSVGHVGSDELSAESPWRDLLPYITHWTWYIADLDGGSAEIRFSGFCPLENCKMGLWAWADWDLEQRSVPVAIECPEPAMPEYRERWKRRGVCILSPGLPHEARPTEKAWRSA